MPAGCSPLVAILAPLAEGLELTPALPLVVASLGALVSAVLSLAPLAEGLPLTPVLPLVVVASRGALVGGGSAG